MDKKTLQEFINKVDTTHYVHCSNYNAKLNSELDQTQLKALFEFGEKYKCYYEKNLELKGFSQKVIKERVDCLNEYYDFLDKKNVNTIFTSQSKFRPTILEEFMLSLIHI